MKNEDEYGFIAQFKNKTLSAVVSVMPSYPKTEISDVVVLYFADGTHLLIKSDYADVETPFHDFEDDSVLSITQTKNHEPFCNIEELKLSSIQVDEKISLVDLIIDEVSLPNDKESTCSYLVGVLIKTPNHQFNIWKDLMTGFFLHADYHFGRTKGIYSPEDRWCVYDNALHVKRIKFSVFDNNECIISDEIVKDTPSFRG